MKFSPGDKVVCVDSKGAEHLLCIGKLYTIKTIICTDLPEFVTIEETFHREWFANRFKLFKEIDPRDQEIAELKAQLQKVKDELTELKPREPTWIQGFSPDLGPHAKSDLISLLTKIGLDFEIVQKPWDTTVNVYERKAK